MINSQPCPSTLFLLLLLTTTSSSADPDPMQDFCVVDLKSTTTINGFPCKLASELTADDFFFSGFAKEVNTSNDLGSFVTFGNVEVFPGLNTLRISMNRVDIAFGGLNPPHSHPRASEAGVVVQRQVLAGFVTTDGMFHSKVLTASEMFVIPRGLVHFKLNVGIEKAILITSFNSKLPFATVSSLALFDAAPSVPDRVLAKSLRKMLFAASRLSSAEL